MRRTFEWILSALAVFVSVGGAITIYRLQLNLAPQGSLWPMPALVLIQVVLLAVLGFLGTAMDREVASLQWGFLPWFASGGLLALGGLGTYGVTILALLVAPAFGFALTSILADRRRNRRILNHLSVLAMGVVINFGLLFVFVTV